MTETTGIYVALDSDFAKPPLGSVVRIEAVDWGMVDRQAAQGDPIHTIVKARLYGEVIICNDEWITLAPQVFDGGDVRCALSVPWVTVQVVTILEVP